MLYICSFVAAGPISTLVGMRPAAAVNCCVTIQVSLLIPRQVGGKEATQLSQKPDWAIDQPQEDIMTQLALIQRTEAWILASARMT